MKTETKSEEILRETMELAAAVVILIAAKQVWHWYKILQYQRKAKQRVY